MSERCWCHDDFTCAACRASEGAPANARLSPEARYARDPWFRTLVDVLTAHLERSEFRDNYTPTELREAVILAAQRQEHIRAYRQRYYFPDAPSNDRL